MRSQSRPAPVMFVLSLAFAGLCLSACGDKRSVPKNVLEKPLSATGFAHQVVDKLDPANKQRIDSNLEKYRDYLEKSFVASQQVPQGSLAYSLAGYADDRKSDINNQTHDMKVHVEYLARLKNDTPGKVTDDAILSTRAKIAENVLRIELATTYLNKALDADLMVKEAARRQGELLKTKPDDRTSIQTLLADVQEEPCATAKSGTASSSRFAMRGVELGMTAEKVVPALCAEEKNEVRFVNKPEWVKSHQDLTAGGENLAWQAYRSGGAAYQQNFLSNFQRMGAWRSVVDATAKPYVATNYFCLGCDAGDFDNSLKVTYLPDGTVVSLDRDQNFVDRTKQTGSQDIVSSTPQPITKVLSTLKAQFGEPSFRSESGWAWVFPDRKTPLPPETWTFTSGSDPKRFGLPVYSAALNGHILPAERDPGLRGAVNALHPGATYCVNRYLGSSWLSSDRPRFPIAPLFTYGGSGFGAVTAYPLEAPYNKSLEPAGQIDRCGIVVYAQWRTNGPNSMTGISLHIMDVDRISDSQTTEARDVITKVQGLEHQAQERSATPFKP